MFMVKIRNHTRRAELNHLRRILRSRYGHPAPSLHHMGLFSWAVAIDGQKARGS
jgi:hypothetical protein